MSLTRLGEAVSGRPNRCRAALNILRIAFGGRLSVGRE
jgi:hypothetical protein